jgi:hypothetical protein
MDISKNPITESGLPSAGTGLWAFQPSSRRLHVAYLAACPLLLNTGEGLQLLAPGPLRRSVLPLAGRVSAQRSGGGLHRGRIRPNGAKTSHAVSGSGCSAPSGRSGYLRSQSPPGAGDPRSVPRHHAPRRQPAAFRSALHSRHHFPRFGIVPTRSEVMKPN